MADSGSMRASYVNGRELLTPIGEFIAARLPHIESARDLWGGNGRVFRIYGFGVYYRRCLLDYTKAQAWRRLRIMGITVYEQNSQYSGAPNAFNA